MTSQREVVKYLVLERPIKIQSEPLSVEVAFRLDKGKGGKEVIVPEKNSKLVVFFPTERETFLEFVVQGPYVTTPSRENIPFKNEQNQKIIDETGKLVAASLPVIRDLGYLNTDFLSMLPIDSEQTDHIYSKLYDKVKDKLLSGKFLPDLQGGHTTPGKAVLADGRGLTEFLKKTDLNELFSRTTWLNTNITDDRTPELREYLIGELGVYEVNFRSFAAKITRDFLKRKSDKWMVEFYSRLLGQRALWNKNGSPHSLLNTKPIMRLDTGEHITPFNENMAIQVYLPAEAKSSSYPTLKQVFVKNERSFEFLRELRIKKPDFHDYVRKFVISKYKEDATIKNEENIKDFKNIFKSYSTIRSGDEKERLEEGLLNTKFIPSVDSSGKTYRCTPGRVYMPSSELRTFFKGNESVRFVSDRILEKDEDENVTKFLRDLGVEDKPRRVEAQLSLTWDEKYSMHRGWCTRERKSDDYEYEGLDNLIESGFTSDKSYLLWGLLLKSLAGLHDWQAQAFFRGTYRWFYYTKQQDNFPPKFLKTLRETEWLVDKDGQLRKPSDITISELSSDYRIEGSNADILVKVLEFAEEIQEEPTETEYSEASLERLLTER